MKFTKCIEKISCTATEIQERLDSKLFKTLPLSACYLPQRAQANASFYFDFLSNKLYFPPQLWKLSGCELTQFPPPAGQKIISLVTAFKGKATRAPRNTNSSSASEHVPLGSEHRIIRPAIGNTCCKASWSVLVTSQVCKVNRFSTATGMAEEDQELTQACRSPARGQSATTPVPREAEWPPLGHRRRE